MQTTLHQIPFFEKPQKTPMQKTFFLFFCCLAANNAQAQIQLLLSCVQKNLFSVCFTYGYSYLTPSEAVVRNIIK